jgi:excisionase family DNA binding protein
MSDEKLVTIREAAAILSISEKEIIDLAESGKIPAYKIGGVYLRFKREQLEEVKRNLHLAGVKHRPPEKYSFGERVAGFFYFNDFYILSLILIAVIFLFISQGQ